MKYQIKNELIVATIESKGAEIKSIKFNGEERMHDSNPKYWGRTAPILFPNIGTILDGYSTFDNVKYPMEKHGIIRDVEFNVLDKNEKSILFQLKANESTLKKYPFNFELQIKYYLENNKILSEIKVINNEINKKMNFNLGLHPAFKTPIKEDEKFEDYHFEFETTRTYELPIVNLNNGTIDFMNRNRTLYNLNKLSLNYDDYNNDAVILENIDFNQVVLTNNKHGVKFTFNEFPMLGIWTPNTIHSPFICIEPWIGCADRPDTNHEYNSKRDLITLKANESKTIKYNFEFF